MTNAPIIWGGNNTATNLQSFLTSNNIGRNSSSARNYISTWYFFNQDPTVGIVTTLTSTGNRATNTQFWGSSTTGLLSYVTSSASYLRSPGSAQIAVTGAGGTQFVETPMFTLDAVDVGTNLSLTFDYNTSGTFAAGDCNVVVIQYDVSGTYVQTITPSITALPSSLSLFSCSFGTSATATSQYSIRFTSNNAALRTFIIDSLSFGPPSSNISAAIGPWLAYTPAWVGLGTVTNSTGFYRRVGDTMEIMSYMVSGTATGTTASMSLPTGYSINTAVMPINNPTGSVNSIIGVFGSDGAAGVGNVLYSNTSATVVYFSTLTTTSTTLRANTGVNVSNNNSYFVVKCAIPIAQWGVQTTFANSTVEFVYNTSTNDAADTTSFGYGAAGGVLPGALTAARLKRVQFVSTIQPTDSIQIEIQPAGTGTWEPLTGYNVSALVSNAQLQNTTTYGIGYSTVSGSSTQLDVNFGQYAYASGTTYASAGTSWASATASTRYRVRKSAGIGLGQLVPATNNSGGYLSQGSAGNYTPTTSGATGFFSTGTNTINQHNYSQVNNIVTVTGSISFTGATLAASGTITISIPVALISTFSNTLQASGSIGASSTLIVGGGNVTSTSGGSTILLTVSTSATVTALTASYSFTYKIQ